MKVSLKWLSDYVEVPTDIKEFCDRLDLTGTGVEGVEKTGAQFDGVVVGHVLTCEEHPDSDHMHVVTVDVGAGRHGGRRSAGRLQDQEVEAARRGEHGHVLLQARAGHGRGPFGHLGAA